MMKNVGQLVQLFAGNHTWGHGGLHEAHNLCVQTFEASDLSGVIQKRRSNGT